MATTAQPAAHGDVVALIDRQLEFLHRTRSVFPRLQKSMAGESEFEAPPYYRNLGYHVVVKLAQPMTPDFIDGLFELGHWVNENFVVRLWAILESNGIVGKQIAMNQTLDGWEDVDLVRRLRNTIGHGSGVYDSDDPDKQKLFEKIVARYDIPGGYSYFEVEKYPIGVGRVLVPMANGCKRYVKAVMDAQAGAEPGR